MRLSHEEKYLAAKAKYDEDMKTFLANGGEKKARKSREDKAEINGPRAQMGLLKSKDLGKSGNGQPILL